MRLTLSFQKINEKPQVIADYESGRAIPNNQVMGKIERAIGKLRKEVSKLETVFQCLGELRAFVGGSFHCPGQEPVADCSLLWSQCH